MRISDWSSDVCSSDLADDKSVRRIGLDALTHGLHDLQIDAQQVIAAHARLASDPGSNNDDVRASNVGIIVRALQVRIKAFHRAALGKVKCFTLRHALNHVEQEIGKASCRERVWQYV